MLVARGTLESEGCTGLAFEIDTDETIDSAYIRLVLPNDIKASHVGIPSEFDTGNHTVPEQMWEMKRINNECTITQTASVFTAGISAIPSGNVLTIRTPKLAGKTQILGFMVLDSTSPSPLESQEETLSIDSEFEYTKWGAVIKRKFKVHHDEAPK